MEGWCVMPLPDRPNLEYLKKLAKEKLQDLQRADASAQLADAQLAVAREHGFASWRKLRAHLDALRPAGEPSGRAELPREQIEEFYGAINRADEATVERMLTVEPALVNARHPDGTTPLLAAADRNRPGLIALLLARGGDPDGVYAHSAHTPLSWAVTSEHFEVADALRRGGVAPDLYCAAGLDCCRSSRLAGIMRQHVTPSPCPLPRGERDPIPFIPLPHSGGEGRRSSRDARLERRGEG